MKAARKLQKLQQPQSFIDYVRKFLTPEVWKQGRQSVRNRRALPRWDLQPLILVLLTMTWAGGESQSERFEAARGFYVLCHESRTRPGKTLAGFRKAVARLPMAQLRALAQGVRQQIRAVYRDRLLIDGFEPFGCDGSRIETPRACELECRLGKSGNEGSAPTIWVTAIIHLGLGLLWSWQIGKGTADERRHLRQLLGTLPPAALIVTDAAYMSYALAQAIIQNHQSFLFRLSSKVHLYTLEEAALQTWEEGLVYYWPQDMQRKGEPPLQCRLIRVRAAGQTKNDVWLLTNVLDSTRLSVANAAKFYRWRWRNEGLFRTYKRTLQKVKLSSRTVRMIHREAEGSLLALQILLAHADLAPRPEAVPGSPTISPRKVLIEIRREIKNSNGQTTLSYRERLETCRVDSRQQRTPKAIRAWPRRKPHKPPRPPKLRTLHERLKPLFHKHIQAL
jgi:hypothetical protein